MFARYKRYLRGKWFDWKYRNVPRGYCCCGARMDSHHWTDGHAPVEDYEYARDCYVRGI